MADWKKIIAAHFEAVRVDDSATLITGPPAPAAELLQFGENWGITLPPEFVEMYSVYNGWGAKYPGEDEESLWFCVPTDRLPEFASSVRRWFEDTHPQYSERFFPFIDFANGDGLGYMLSGEGELIDGLFMLEHELYEHDEDQDINEFLTHAPISLQAFLESCGA